MILLDILPAASAVALVVGLSYRAGQIVQNQNHLIEDVKELRTDMREVKTELKDLDKRVIVVETKISGSNQKNA
jgi:hypothetical protein